MFKTAGNNSHGNRNERSFVNEINSGLGKMGLNLKEFIRYICKNEGIEYSQDLRVKAEYESRSKLKQDVYIYINEKQFNISLKMGSGNSVHQEKCEDFIDYIKKEFKATEEVCNSWRFFLWADGTYDGTGSLEKDINGVIKSRFTSRKFKTQYPEKRNKLQDFIHENETKLIEHFLFEGRHKSRVDYLYHGTHTHGNWISKDQILNHQLINSKNNPDSRTCLSVGKMSIQSWNISQKEIQTKKEDRSKLNTGA